MKNEEKTLKELQAELEAAKKAYELIQQTYNKKEAEEAEAKKAKLKAEKDARYKEVIDAYENFEELREKYVEDYGSFTFTSTGNLPHWWNMFSI